MANEKNRTLKKYSNCLVMAVSNGNLLAELVHGIEVEVFFFPIVITHRLLLILDFRVSQMHEMCAENLRILVHFCLRTKFTFLYHFKKHRIT